MYYCSYIPTSFHIQWMHVTVKRAFIACGNWLEYNTLTNQESLYEDLYLHVITDPKKSHQRIVEVSS